jgi:hypothetical protein
VERGALPLVPFLPVPSSFYSLSASAPGAHLSPMDLGGHDVQADLASVVFDLLWL